MSSAMPILDRQKLETAVNLIANWDFSLTKQKLLEVAYAGWSQERADLAERDYKRYLAITHATGGYQPVPNADIDRFWHEHILDTRRYARDCEDLFGEFLHHYPFFGMRGEADEAMWKSTIGISEQLWSDAFGESLYGSALDPQKCPQACPNPGIEGDGRHLPQKCPQACPNPGIAVSVH